MNVVISQEHRFDRTPDGAVWTQGAFSHSYFAPYLEIFDSVRVVARVRDVAVTPPNARRADTSQVSFHAVPYYVGPEQYLLKWGEVRQALRNCVSPDDAVILRVQSQIAAGIEPTLHRTGHPYALEVMCDPFAMFAARCNDHLLRPLFQQMFYRQMRKQCSRATAVSYVTEQSLQERYPAAKAAVTASYSNVEMPEAAYVPTARSFLPKPSPLNVISVASLDQPYKGIDVLIDAVHISVTRGLDLSLTVIGDGVLRRSLETQANKLEGRARFIGHVSSGAAIREYLDQAHLFVLPSRTEGLPRALIEAMARALPCICSAVGGIPELLPVSDLVPAGDAVALSSKFCEVLASPERMLAMSARNLGKAQQYRDDVLRLRRSGFYRKVKEITQAWIKKQIAGQPSAVSA